MSGAIYVIFNMEVQIDESLLQKDNSGIFAPEGQIYFSGELDGCFRETNTITQSLKIASMEEFIPSSYRDDIESYAGKPIEEIDNVEEVVLEMSKNTWFPPDACLESLEMILTEIDKHNMAYVKPHLLSLKNALLKAKNLGALFRFFWMD